MAHQAIDPRIGARIRALRKSQCLSGRAFADQLGVSHPQVMKYETGKNRISGEILARMAAILNTSVAFFLGEGRANNNEVPLDAARLLNGFAKIKNPQSRMYVLKLVETWPVDVTEPKR